MSRTSTVTVRDVPLKDVDGATGVFTVKSEAIVVDSTDRVQVFDLTEKVMAFVRRSGVKEGMVSVASLHTTCAVFINEYQTALLEDVVSFLESTVDRHHTWVHNDPVRSDCDRSNADAHLRAMMLGHTMTLQVNGGDVVLGQWQRVLTAELDGPRARSIRVSVMGVA